MSATNHETNHETIPEVMPAGLTYEETLVLLQRWERERKPTCEDFADAVWGPAVPEEER